MSDYLDGSEVFLRDRNEAAVRLLIDIHNHLVRIVSLLEERKVDA